MSLSTIGKQQSYQERKEEGGEGEEEEEEDPHKAYCVCRQPYDGAPMVQCEACLEW